MVDKTIYASHPITGEPVPVGEMKDKDYVVSADIAYLETACRTYQLRAGYYWERTQEMCKLLESVLREYQGDRWEEVLIQIETYLATPVEDEDNKRKVDIPQSTLNMLKTRIFNDEEDEEDRRLSPDMLSFIKKNFVRPGKGTPSSDDDDLL